MKNLFEEIRMFDTVARGCLLMKTNLNLEQIVI